MSRKWDSHSHKLPKDAEEFWRKAEATLVAKPGAEGELEVVRSLLSHYYTPAADFVITSTGPLT
jgi:hypothetical protein